MWKSAFSAIETLGKFSGTKTHTHTHMQTIRSHKCRLITKCHCKRNRNSIHSYCGDYIKRIDMHFGYLIRTISHVLYKKNAAHIFCNNICIYKWHWPLSLSLFFQVDIDFFPLQIETRWMAFCSIRIFAFFFSFSDFFSWIKLLRLLNAQCTHLYSRK